jgi:hypothetical protein
LVVQTVEVVDDVLIVILTLILVAVIVILPILNFLFIAFWNFVRVCPCSSWLLQLPEGYRN